MIRALALALNLAVCASALIYGCFVRLSPSRSSVSSAGEGRMTLIPASVPYSRGRSRTRPFGTRRFIHWTRHCGKTAALALVLAACAQPDSGMAGCWEDMNGRYRYRLDSPNVRGMCPTRREMLAAQDYADKARAIECRTACVLGLVLMGLR